jgi:hypothetical protein
MASDDKRDDQPQATKSKLDTIVSHLDAMKTLITSLQKEMNAGDFSGRVRRACIHGGNDSFAKLPFTLPPYNGKYDPAVYLDWELAVEQKFSCHDLPASSQVTAAISAFTDLALHWWRYEQKIPISTPTTWAELKAAMRRRFVPSYYARNVECDVQERRSKQYSNSFAGQSSTSSSAPVFLAPSTLTPTTLESPAPSSPTTTPLERTSASFAISEPSLSNDPPTPTTKTGTAHDATLMDGENCLNVLNFSTNHAIIEHLSVEPSLDESLSHAALLDIPCDKDDLVDDASILHALEPNTIAETKHVMDIVSANDEQKLLSSLHTLGCIEFDVLCNLDCLEEQLSKYTDLPCFSKHTYHAIAKYNNKGEYMIHRVYICENLNYSFVVLNFDPLEGSHTTHIPSPFSSSVLVKQVYFQEGEYCWLLPMPTLSFVGTNLLQGSVAKYYVSSDQNAYMLAKFSMQDDIFINWRHGDIPPHNNFDFFGFRNPVRSCVVQDRFQVQSTPRTAFHQEGENDEDMTLMHTPKIGAWNGVEEVQQGFPSQEGGPRLIRFESPRWRPKAIQVRVQFGVQQ